MQTMYYIGLDVHKRTISYCVKDGSGAIHAEGAIPATRFDLDRWMKTLPQPWTAAMEATVFTGWIYDHLQPHAAALKVAHPLMLRAIAAAKKMAPRYSPTWRCSMTRKSRKAMPIAQRWRWHGSWWPTSWRSTVGSGIFRWRRQVTTSLRKA